MERRRASTAASCAPSLTRKKRGTTWQELRHGHHGVVKDAPSVFVMKDACLTPARTTHILEMRAPPKRAGSVDFGLRAIHCAIGAAQELIGVHTVGRV